MIFRSPPLNPINVIRHQEDFMVWSIEEEFGVEDETNYKCIIIANRFPEKNFIRIKASLFKEFCKSYHLNEQQTVVRVHLGDTVWKAYKPRCKYIWKQASIMKNRRGSIGVVPISRPPSDIKSEDSDSEINENRVNNHDGIERKRIIRTLPRVNVSNGTSNKFHTLGQKKEFEMNQPIISNDFIEELPKSSSLQPNENREKYFKNSKERSKSFLSKFKSPFSFLKTRKRAASLFRRMSFRKSKNSISSSHNYQTQILNTSSKSLKTKTTRARSISLNLDSESNSQHFSEVENGKPNEKLFLKIDDMPTSLPRSSYFDFETIKPSISLSSLNAEHFDSIINSTNAESEMKNNKSYSSLDFSDTKIFEANESLCYTETEKRLSNLCLDDVPNSKSRFHLSLKQKRNENSASKIFLVDSNKKMYSSNLTMNVNKDKICTSNLSLIDFKVENNQSNTLPIANKLNNEQKYLSTVSLESKKYGTIPRFFVENSQNKKSNAHSDISNYPSMKGTSKTQSETNNSQRTSTINENQFT